MFGAPVSYENNIERALNFMLQLKKAVTKINYRAGLSFGTVYAGILGGKQRCEYTAIGDIVNLSARFMMKADWNTVWVSENIFNSQKDNFEFKELGEFSFKGKAGKIPTFQLVKEKEFTDLELFEGTTIGRDKELKLFLKFIKPLFKNQFVGITYVYGEAGMGKSRLVWEFKNILTKMNENGQKNQINWFYMPCEEILRASFNPIIFFLKNYFHITEEKNTANFKDQINKLLDKLINLKNNPKLKNSFQNSKKFSNALGEIVSDLKRTKSILGGYIGIEWQNSLYSQLNPKERYANFLLAVKNLIKAESLIKPVVIDLEDSQWVDFDTQKILKILVENTENFPITIICPSRYADDGSEFKLNISDNTRQLQIDLNVLSKKNIAKYSQIVLDTSIELSKNLLSFIYEKTNGNPFFVEQVLLNLKEQYLIIENKDSLLDINQKNVIDIPTNIQSILISRLDRFSEEIKKIVQSASVLGKEFYIKILTDILKNDPEIDKKLSYIENEKIWTVMAHIKYMFKHALFRDSVYDMQLKQRLKELHNLAAESYISIYKDSIELYYGDIAYHYEKSEDIVNSLHYLEKAGSYAKDNFYNQNALNFFERWIVLANKSLGIEKNNYSKIEINDLNQDLVEKYINIVVFNISYLYSGIFNKHEKALEILTNTLPMCEKLKTKDQLNYFYIEIGNMNGKLRRFDIALKYLNNSLKYFEKSKDLKRMSGIEYLLGIYLYQTAQREESILHLEKCLDLSKKNMDKKTESNAVSLLGMIYDVNGDAQKALKYYENSLDISKSIDDKMGIQVAIGNIGAIYYDKKAYDKALNLFKEKVIICKNIGNIRGQAMGLKNIAEVYSILLNYTDSLKSFEKAEKMYIEINDFLKLTDIYISIANCYKELTQYENSLVVCEKGIINAKKYSQTEFITKGEILKKDIEICISQIGL